MMDWNYLALSGAATFALSMSVAMVLISGRFQEIRVLWSLFNIFVGLWGLGLFFGSSSNLYSEALFWFRFLNYIAIFIPAFFFHFVLSFCGVIAHNEGKLKFGYVTSVLLLITAIIFPDSFVRDVVPKLSLHYYPLPGPLYYLFLLLFAWPVLHGLYFLLKQRRIVTLKRRLQLDYLILGVIIGFSGGSTTFPLVFGINLYPFGAISVVIMNVIIAYAIVKHRLIVVSSLASAFITRLILYPALLSLFFLVHFIAIGRLLPENNVFMLLYMTLLIATCEAYSVIMAKIQKFSALLIIRKRRNYIEAINIVSNRMVSVVTLPGLRGFLQDFTIKFLGSELSGLYVLDDTYNSSKQYCMVVEDGETDTVCSITNPVELESEIILDAIKTKTPVEISSPDEKMIFIPLVVQKQLIGFVLLQRSERDLSYSHYDLLNVLSGHLSVVLDRILAYKKISLHKEELLRAQIIAKKSLAGSIAHEMRTPLHSISLASFNFFEDLLRRFPHTSEPTSALDRQGLSVSQNMTSTPSTAISITESDIGEIKRARDFISNSIKRALETIDMTLATLRDEAINPNTFVYLSAKEILQKIIEEYGYKDDQERLKVKLSIEGDFFMKALETPLIFIVSNLIKNSLFYLKSNPEMEVTIGTKTSNQHNIIFVYDTGPGISDEIKSKLFQAFFTSNKAGGTGLGLDFCKRAMIGFSGDIICESEFGEWTRFSLLFPRLNSEEEECAIELMNDRDKQAEVIDSITDNVNLSHKRVLLVEDDRVSALVSSTLLKNQLKINADIAGGVAEAITKLSQSKYDLILLDYNLPDMKGDVIAKCVRSGCEMESVVELDKAALDQLKENRDIPILCTSADDDPNTIRLCKKSGMNEFIGKLCPDTIKGIMVRWLMLDGGDEKNS